MNELFKLLSGLLTGKKIAFDGEDGWITMNGTPVKVDDKGNPVAGPSNVTGKPSGGSGSASESVAITGNELGSYADIKELRAKAMDYYKANLQGKPAYREDVGEIRFSRKGLNEARGFSANEDKLLMFPAIRDIVETGKIGKEEAPKHPRKDGIVAFVPVTKTVNFKGKSKDVEVLLGKDGKGNLYYDLFLDGQRQKESPASGARQNSRLAGDSASGFSPVVDINIVILSPRVNPDRIAFDGEGGWITMNGTPVKVDDKGNPVAGPSNITKQAPAKSLDQKRDAVADAMNDIANGKPEATIPNLRDDLEQYGGTNDVTVKKGDAKGGLTHIAEKHGHKVIPGVLEAVIDGEVHKFVKTKKTLLLRKDGYEAVLSLDEHGKKKTWLLTGYDLIEGASDKVKEPSGGSGKVCTRHAPTQSRPILGRPELGADSSFTRIITQIFEKSKTPQSCHDRIAFDAASRRRVDENGFLHVSLCHITKEIVNEYYGHEIPGWQNLGLEAHRIYKGYRPGSELAKAAATFNGLPLLNEHVKDSASNPQKDLRIGNLGTDARYTAPYLDISLIIQDAEAIEALNPSEPGKAQGRPVRAKRELSASYRYDPVFKPGVFRGKRYDFIMTNIRGNHVALVEEGRAGSDVVVADENTIKPRGITMDLKALLEQLLSALSGGATPAGADEDTTAGAEKPAGDNDSGAAEDDGDDFAAKLAAHIDGMEDKDLAAKLKAVVDAVSSAGAADEDPDAESSPADDEDSEGEKDKTAMDRKLRKKRGTAPVTGRQPISINLAMDANAVAANIRAGFQAQIQAARDVRPLIGDVDPLAFDSAAGIYSKALELVGKPSKLKNPQALKELCLLACDSKRVKSAYPVVSSVLANDSKGEADPAFANLGNIRKA